MIVGNFDIVGVAIPPDEAHAPLAVDPDGMQSIPIALERVELVAWRESQTLKGRRIVDHVQSSPRDINHRVRKALLDRLAGEDIRGAAICECPDHGCYISRNTSIFNMDRIGSPLIIRAGTPGIERSWIAGTDVPEG